MRIPFLCLFFATIAVVPNGFGQIIDRIDGSKISADSLQHQVEWLMKSANVCGVALSVSNDNKPVFSRTFGLADVQKNMPLQSSSVMYGASLSKIVFAYVVMQLVQEKVLDLDKPLVEYLDSPLTSYKMVKWKGYQDLSGDERYKKITARMCLMHTTGFPVWRWFEPDQKLRIKTDPGTRYNYSGEGIYFLQFVIEHVTHKNYETIAQERVFKPLSMSNTSQVWQSQFDDYLCYGHNIKGEPFERKRSKDANATGSMNTTLADFTEFYAAFISGKNLTSQSFNKMTRSQTPIKSIRNFGPLANRDSSANDNIQLGYGLGVGVFQTPYGRAFFKEGHDDGWQHFTLCYPEKKIAILIMTNNDNGESIFKDLLAVAIGDNLTPWQWESYIPYTQKN
jgi:D-alanyl-D-alanine-carboxypeptidase/D-alanyl-D-alanine-endopeptidase